MANGNGTHSGHFLVEYDGVAALEASEVTGIEKETEPFEIKRGNKSMPIYGRGKSKVSPVTFKHALAINSSGAEVFQYFDDYTNGLTTEKRNFRIVQLAEDGFTPQGVYEFINTVPTKFKMEDNKADGKDAAMYSFTLQPEDLVIDTDG
jgi:phage tail-like protein